MFETWPDDSAPNYSVQTTHLKKGTVDHAAKAWSTYGGRVGVWRLMRTLERLGIPATFFVNARCTEQYPDAVKQIVKSGFDIAAHSYTQDDLPSYKTLGRAAGADPPEHRHAGSLRRQEGHRLGQPGGGVHAGDRGLPQAGRPEMDLRRHLRRPADQDPHAARPDRRRADHGLLRQPRAARLVARSLRRASRHVRLSAPARDDRLADAGDPLPVRRPSADHRGADGAAAIHGRSRATPGSPRTSAGRLGAQAGRRRAHLPEPLFRRHAKTNAEETPCPTPPPRTT